MFLDSRFFIVTTILLSLLTLSGVVLAAETTSPNTTEVEDVADLTAATNPSEQTSDYRASASWLGPDVLHTALVGGGGGSCSSGGPGSTSCSLGNGCSVPAGQCSEGEYACCNPDDCGCAGGGGAQ